MAAGTTASFGAGASDFLVAKVTTGGGIQWAKAYGGTGYAYAKCIRQTSDGGYIIAGWTDSSGTEGRDFLVVKVGSTGAFQWARTYGGVHNDEAYSIDEAPDNGYFVAGYAYTSETDSKDFLILKLSSTGSIQWQKTFGGKKYQVVFLFQDSKTFKNFVENGWEATADASAAAGKAGAGAQTNFVNGLAIYQIDTKGLTASVDIAGTKYFKDKELN